MFTASNMTAAKTVAPLTDVVLCPKILDRLTARRDAVIVNDDVPSDRQLVEEVRQCVHRGFVEIAVEPKHGEALDRRARKISLSTFAIRSFGRRHLG